VIEHFVLVISSLGAGGGERQAVNLVNALVADERVSRVTLLCTRLSEQRDRFYLPLLDPRVTVDAYYDSALKLTAEDIPSLAGFKDLLVHIQPRSRLQVLLQLAKRLERERADAVEGWMDETFINVAVACAMLGQRNKIAGHWVNVPPEEAHQPDESKRDKARYLYRAYQEIVRLPGLRYSSNSALNGQAYARWLDLPAAAVATIHNGICQEALVSESIRGPECRASLNIPANAPVIGSIMRLVEQKRPLLWIDVAACLSALRPGLHFVLLGEGCMRAQLEAYVDELGLSNVHLCGNRKEVGAWLAAFDVFLLCSRIEGVPNAAVEAQLSGCPVIAQAVGGLGEIVRDGETGLLLNDDDPDVIAQAVIRVLDSAQLRTRLIDTAKVEARQRHSLAGLKEAHILLHND
jgi:glycosyltransferase involved in cell wall biosynthesis